MKARWFIGVGLSNVARCALVIALSALPGCQTQRSADRPYSAPHPPPPIAIATPNSPATSGPAVPAAPEAGGPWRALFDGKSLAGWAETDFAGRGPVKVSEGKLILETGLMTGVTWTNAADLPRINYEIALDAMRVDGSDFFCALTFPVKEDPCSFIVGGWGGSLVGLSSLDGQDAANNDTTRFMSFDNGKWYALRVRVTETNLQCWIDSDKVVDVETKDRRISIRSEVEGSRPLGIASWSTTAALRNIRLRKL
jgi:hypothetical protein